MCPSHRDFLVQPPPPALQEVISHEEHKEVEEVIEPALDKGPRTSSKFLGFCQQKVRRELIGLLGQDILIWLWRLWLKPSRFQQLGQQLVSKELRMPPKTQLVQSSSVELSRILSVLCTTCLIHRLIAYDTRSDDCTKLRRSVSCSAADKTLVKSCLERGCSVMMAAVWKCPEPVVVEAVNEPTLDAGNLRRLLATLP